MIIDPGPTAIYCSRPRTANTVDLRNELAYALTPPPARLCRWGYEPRAHLVVGGHALKVAPHHGEARRGRESSPGHCHEVFSRHRVDFGANLLLKQGFPQKKKKKNARGRTEDGGSEGRRGCEHNVALRGWRCLPGSKGASHKNKYNRECVGIYIYRWLSRLFVYCTDVAKDLRERYQHPYREYSTLKASRGMRKRGRVAVRFSGRLFEANNEMAFVTKRARTKVSLDCATNNKTRRGLTQKQNALASGHTASGEHGYGLRVTRCFDRRVKAYLLFTKVTFRDTFVTNHVLFLVFQ